MEQYLICFKDNYFIFELTSNMYAETIDWLESIKAKPIGRVASDILPPDPAIQKFNVLNSNDLQEVASALIDYI